MGNLLYSAQMMPELYMMHFRFWPPSARSQDHFLIATNFVFNIPWDVLTF